MDRYDAPEMTRMQYMAWKLEIAPVDLEDMTFADVEDEYLDAFGEDDPWYLANFSG